MISCGVTDNTQEPMLCQPFPMPGSTFVNQRRKGRDEMKMHCEQKKEERSKSIQYLSGTKTYLLRGTQRFFSVEYLFGRP